MKIRHFIAYIFLIYATQSSAEPTLNFYGKWKLQFNKSFKAYELEIVPGFIIRQEQITYNDKGEEIKQSIDGYWGYYNIKTDHTNGDKTHPITTKGIWFIDIKQQEKELTMLTLTKQKTFNQTRFLSDIIEKETYWTIYFRPILEKDKFRFYLRTIEHEKILFSGRAKRVKQNNRHQEL